MVYFQTKNCKLGKFRRAFGLKTLLYFMVIWSLYIWYILWPFCNVVVICYIFTRFGILCQEKSGNPETLSSRKKHLSFLSLRIWLFNVLKSAPVSSGYFRADYKKYFDSFQSMERPTYQKHP
jgi:hypothetical protein